MAKFKLTVPIDSSAIQEAKGSVKVAVVDARGQTQSQVVDLIFQYVGHSSLTVYGPSTGRKYWFGGHGAELAVDLRDRASLRDVPNIREVRLATV